LTLLLTEKGINPAKNIVTAIPRGSLLEQIKEKPTGNWLIQLHLENGCYIRQECIILCLTFTITIQASVLPKAAYVGRLMTTHITC